MLDPLSGGPHTFTETGITEFNRPPDYESGGQEFESLRARQWNQRFLSNIEIIPSQNSDLGRSWEGEEVSRQQASRRSWRRV
jgi:hypothetical protein